MVSGVSADPTPPPIPAAGVGGAPPCVTLAELRRYFELFFAADPAPHVLTRLSNGGMLLVNPATISASGYSAEELLSGTVGALFAEDDAARAEFVALLRADGRLDNIERRLIIRSGAQRRVRFSATLLNCDGQLCALASIRDVTHLIEARSALRYGERQLAMITDALPVIISYVDRNLVYRYVNGEFERILGTSRGSVLGKRIDTVTSAQAWPQVEPALDAALRGHARQTEVRLRRPDGRQIVYDLKLEPDRNIDGAVVGIHMVSIDVSRRFEYEETLERFERIVNTSQDFMAFVGRDQCYKAVNHTYAQAFGMPVEMIVGKRVRDVFADSPYGTQVCRAIEAALAGRDQRLRLRLDLADGRHEIDSRVTPFFRADGAVNGAVVCGRDITELRLAERALVESEERFRALYDDNPSILFTLDIEAQIRSINRFGAEHLGYSPAELRDRSIDILVADEERAAVRCYVDECFAGPRQVCRTELVLTNRGGEKLWVRPSGRVVEGADGRPLLLVVCEDITETKRLSQQLEYQATHDALTGLVNRSEFERRVKRLLDPELTLADHALCFLDLDQFKIINDSCGHVAGDELLRHVATLLKGNVRRHDTLARMGGDEFGLLMEHCKLEQAERVAGEILSAIREFQFSWDGRYFRIGVSIGVVAINEHSGSVPAILRAADEACYAAKARGRNRVCMHHQISAGGTARRVDGQWMESLETALRNGRIELYWQPVAVLAGSADDTPLFDVTPRMPGTDGESILPNTLLPAAERHSFGARVDLYVAERLLDFIEAGAGQFAPAACFKIGLSGQVLGDDARLDALIDLFDRRRGVAPRICYEIPESAAVSNLTATIRIIDYLRPYGVRFALGGYGSGLSSFQYLKNLPVEFLCIDANCVSAVVDDPIDQAAVGAIASLARVAGKRTIAPAVARPEILAQLAKLGVDYVQGPAVAPAELLQ